MNRFYQLLAVLAVMLAPPYLYWRISEDMAHPELWEDPLHNPVVDFLSLGVFGVILALAAVVFTNIAKDRARLDREFAETMAEIENDRQHRRQ